MKKSITEIFAEGFSPSVDLALAAVGVVPGFSSAVNFLKAVDNLQSRLAIAKILAFIEGTKSVTQEEISSTEKRLDESDERHEVAESLLLAIDSFTALDKCELLGVLYLAFLKGVISSGELRRLTHAIDAAFIDDLKHFLLNPNPAPWEKSQDPTFYLHLEKVGLTKFNNPAFIRGNVGGPPKLEVTELGKLLRTAIWSIRPFKRSAIPEDLKHTFREPQSG